MQLLRNDVERILKKGKLDVALLEVPPKAEMGDYAFPCFSLSKKMKKAPAEIAKDIASKMKASGFIRKIRAEGPYVNFFGNWEKLGEKTLKKIAEEGGRFGSGKKSEKMMIEFAHPNTHKALHIGHARNLTLGEALSRTMSFAGYDVKRVNYQGDIGPHVARCIWGLMNLKEKEPEKGKGEWLGRIYAKASTEAKNYNAEKEIRETNKDLYAGKPELLKLWKKTRKWSLDYFDEVYRDFGIKFDRFYFESEVEGPAIKLARELEKKGTAKMSEGAIVMDLEKYGLGIFVLLTQDGTPLYSVKDFILARMQDKEYKPDRIIHVVGSEQELHFRQVFRGLELMKSPIARKEYHLSYGLVNLESGKMKSREGRVILYEELKEKTIETAREITMKKNPKLSKTELEKIARTIGLGALKYDMVKVSPEKTIIFDWNRALSFEGNNAPYLQYTHARCCSILGKAGKPGKYDASLLKEESEISLLRKLSSFPVAVERAGREMRPHYVATYIYELCDAFNEFYQKVPVIKAAKEKAARIALVDSVRITIRNALNLLGIEAPEKM
ncbi:MAG: arginine--tRNA ligase [Candidatus Aenigmarchaeota archaeon]|nr:arginine--tRNA ligase [Candidatus Aenigmarchaeota archaeon]